MLCMSGDIWNCVKALKHFTCPLLHFVKKRDQSQSIHFRCRYLRTDQWVPYYHYYVTTIVYLFSHLLWNQPLSFFVRCNFKNYGIMPKYLTFLQFVSLQLTNFFLAYLYTHLPWWYSLISLNNSLRNQSHLPLSFISLTVPLLNSFSRPLTNDRNKICKQHPYHHGTKSYVSFSNFDFF